MLNWNGECGHLCFVSELRRKAFKLLHLSMMEETGGDQRQKWLSWADRKMSYFWICTQDLSQGVYICVSACILKTAFIGHGLPWGFIISSGSQNSHRGTFVVVLLPNYCCWWGTIRPALPWYESQIRIPQENKSTANIPDGYTWKNSQQNISKPNSTTPWKDHTSWPSGIYFWDARMGEHKQINNMIHHINK